MFLLAAPFAAGDAFFELGLLTTLQRKLLCQQQLPDAGNGQSQVAEWALLCNSSWSFIPFKDAPFLPGAIPLILTVISILCVLTLDTWMVASWSLLAVVLFRACQWPFGHDCHHGHALPRTVSPAAF